MRVDEIGREEPIPRILVPDSDLLIYAKVLQIAYAHDKEIHRGNGKVNVTGFRNRSE